jgi:hypothetical protein
MLKFFSRLEKTRNVVILIFGLLLVFSMVFFGASIIGTGNNAAVSASWSGRKKISARFTAGARRRASFCWTE